MSAKSQLTIERSADVSRAPTRGRLNRSRRFYANAVTRSRPRFVVTFAAALGLIVTLHTSSFAIEPVRAELDKESAWTGEAVTLSITLYSPGPFSGTATFDLPELAQTVFVKSGNPVVGSDTLDGESVLTQRHELNVYTQQSGEITIPTFQVRFTGKETFTSEPRPIVGKTPELRFQSKRPPGTDSTALVICATAMKLQQNWNPLPDSKIEAGDVIIRTITRNAEGTTAMLLPPIPDDAPEGVEVYAGKPEVQDQVERGDSRAVRTDTIKYQFQQPGRFTLPELTMQWWDPIREKLQSESVSGLAIEVATPNATTRSEAEAQTPRSSRWVSTAAALLALGAVLWLVYKPTGRWIAAWKAHRSRPEAVATRKLRSACATNDAAESYAAFTAWLTAQRAIYGTESVQRFFEGEPASDLHEQWQELSRSLFSSVHAATPWSGSRFWDAFARTRRLMRQRAPKTHVAVLPALNPVDLPT